MPVELQIIRASEFVRLDPHELLDFEASKQALQAIARACLKRGVCQAIIDLRQLTTPAKPLFTKTELASLVLIFRDAGFSEQGRLAILYRQDIHGGIRDFAFISRLRGMHVQAFTDFEAALQWLSEDDQTATETRKGEIPISISKPQREARRLPVRSIVRRHKEKKCGPGVHNKRFVRPYEQ